MFDFSQVLEQANAAMNGGNNGNQNRQKLIYPQVGSLQVKLLFNAKSATLMRLVNRHTINQKKVPCLKGLSASCPICDTLTNIKNAKSLDLGKLGSQVRGIAMVQYIGSDIPYEGVKSGDVVLMMFPWTVYKEINSTLTQATSNDELKKIMASNDAIILTINRGRDNKYSAQLNPFKTYRSFETDAEFENLLSGLDSLNDMIFKVPVTPETIKLVTDTAKELEQRFLLDQQPQFQQPVVQDAAGFNNFQQPQQYQQPPVVPQPDMSDFSNPFATQQPVQQFQQPTFQQPQFQQQQPNEQVIVGHNQPQQPQQFQQPTVGQANPNQAPEPNTAVNNNSNVPECYGRHGSEDINKCLLCPVEIQCSQSK